MLRAGRYSGFHLLSPLAVARLPLSLPVRAGLLRKTGVSAFHAAAAPQCPTKPLEKLGKSAMVTVLRRALDGPLAGGSMPPARAHTRRSASLAA